MAKCSKIRHIVRLRQMLRRWRQKAASSAASLRVTPELPHDVPAGHVAVCVGSSCRRFVIRAAHLNHPIFRQLLRQAEEEYGFPSGAGPLALPCDEDLFEAVLRHISSSPSSSSSSSTSRSYVTLEDLSRSSPSCFSGHAGRCHGAEVLPLLHGKAVW